MKYVISVDSILAGAATNMCGEFCNPNEEHVKPYGNPKAVDYHFSEEKKLLHSLLISKLPEKDYMCRNSPDYKRAVEDMRKSIDELFRSGDES